MTALEKSAATLILAPSDAAPAGSATPETVLLGLPLLRRAALAARRAGFERVYVLAARGAPLDAVLEGTGARLFPRDAAESALPPGRIVLLCDRVVASPQWLGSLREALVQPGRLQRLGAGAIVETSEPAALARALARGSSLPAKLGAMPPVTIRPTPPRARSA